MLIKQTYFNIIEYIFNVFKNNMKLKNISKLNEDRLKIGLYNTIKYFAPSFLDKKRYYGKYALDIDYIKDSNKAEYHSIKYFMKNKLTKRWFRIINPI